MLLSLIKSHAPHSNMIQLQKKKSLSTYFPKGTQYFYGYPSGEDSGFLNQVPPTTEELVAQRAESCAGNHVKVVQFASTSYPNISNNILNGFGLPQLKNNQKIVLPEDISIDLNFSERNKKIKSSLIVNVEKNKFVMAQPYLNDELQNFYQIPPKITAWLNDKSNLDAIIGKSMVPKRIASFTNGAELVNNSDQLIASCVIKATSSSAGDGVYICKTLTDIKNALVKLKNVEGSIIVEELVEASKNYGVHFGIPHKQSKNIDFIGVNEQLTTDKGEFIGGIIKSAIFPNELNDVKSHILENVLPKVRSMGWYGIGCFDVLIDKNGKPYVIDCNFRMTGMSAYHFLVANNKIDTPLVGFSGDFYGTEKQFEGALYKFGGKNCSNKIMEIIALNKHEEKWSFNAALFFNDTPDMKQNIKYLLDSGVKSPALSLLLNY